MTADEIQPGNALAADRDDDEVEVKGIFLMPMSHHFAQHLVDELAPLALQLGPHAAEFYQGLVIGLEEAATGKQGMLYSSNDVEHSDD